MIDFCVNWCEYVGVFVVPKNAHSDENGTDEVKNP